MLLYRSFSNKKEWSCCFTFFCEAQHTLFLHAICFLDDNNQNAIYDAVLFLCADIATKLGRKDASDLSPTEIAIEVLHNFCLMPLTPFQFVSFWQTGMFTDAKAESKFCITDANLIILLYLAGARANWQLFKGRRWWLCKIVVRFGALVFWLFIFFFFNLQFAIKAMLLCGVVLSVKIKINVACHIFYT